MSAHRLDTASLTRDLESADSRLAGITLDGPRHRSLNSEVYLGRTDHLPYDLAVKKCTKAPDARLAFNTLKRLSEIPSEQTDYTFPQPVGLYCDDTVMVTEWIDAPSFRVQILNQRSPKRVIANGARRSAKWLKWFHSIDAGALGHLDVQSKLHDGFVNLSSREFTPNDKVITEARDLLFDTSHMLSSYPTTMVLIHGDFKPENILISDQTVVGVDIARQHRTCGDEDVAHFLIHMELLSALPRGIRHYKNMSGFVQKFLDNYYETDKDLARYYWIRLQHCLRFWEYYCLRGNRSLVNRYHALCLRRLVKRASKDLRVYLLAQ